MNNTNKKHQELSSTTAKAVMGYTRCTHGSREEQKVAINQSIYQPKNNANNTSSGKKQQQCNYFFQKGSCKFGTRCIYSHTLVPTTQQIKKQEADASAKEKTIRVPIPQVSAEPKDWSDFILTIPGREMQPSKLNNKPKNIQPREKVKELI